MARWLLASLGACFITLLGARFVPGPQWIVFLWLAAAFGAASVALACGWFVTARWPLNGKAIVALTLGVSATLARHALIAELGKAHGPPRIEVVPLSIAMATLAWGALALLWGTSALTDFFESPTPSRRRVLIPVAATAVVLGLYCLAPLWLLFGVRISGWTILGLGILVTGAYGIDRIHRWITDG